MDYIDILLLCPIRALQGRQDAVYSDEGVLISPEIPDETWKHPSGKVLDFGLNEIIRDYVVLAVMDGKVIAYCNVPEDQGIRIIQHIGDDTVSGNLVWSCYESLQCDPQGQAVADSIFQYPVQRQIDMDGEMQTVQAFISVKDAKAAGVTIDPDQIVMPMAWAGLAVE